jgi:hypothetical protein
MKQIADCRFRIADLRKRCNPTVTGSPAGHGVRPAPSSRFRGGRLTGEPIWPCALIGVGFRAAAMSFITKGAAAETLRVSSSNPVELGCVAA